MGLVYNITCASFAALGSFLFGYDSGIIGGILIQEHFLAAHNNPNSAVQGAIVALFNVGCFFGACVAASLATKWGRKRTIQVGCVFATVGGVIQTASVNVGMFIAGRLIIGIGIGLLSMIVPLYQAEIAPAHIRGFAVGLAQQFIGFGVLVSTWVVYGANRIDSDAQWQIPVGIQIAPAVILFFGTFFLPYSPRWLISVGRKEEARKVVARLYADPEEQEKVYSDIIEEVERELKVVSRDPRDLIKPQYFKRVLLACGGQIGAQFTGINIANYYGPTIYTALGFDTDTSLLVNAIYSVVGPVANFVTITFIVDRVGRVRLMWLGSIGMGTLLMLIGALYKRFPGPTDEQIANDLIGYETTNRSAHYAIICFFYIFSVVFSLSWGPIAWIYQSEIFPLKIRTMGASAATASNWLFNTWISQVSPIALSNPSVGPEFFFVFMSTNYLVAAYTFFFYPETKGRSLEELSEALGDADKKITNDLPMEESAKVETAAAGSTSSGDK
ncbi:general substrate transporter [Zychaea mexicana]|uniref:general substrate transporter n=1 Tax=Zychaea mexicana TaxID=64656 RepID=UPI0022FE258E|nr:general substrate transporter [Zychaea mexicana]KAI9497222.1 general substrate transporter [Zychaea mexicana]